MIGTRDKWPFGWKEWTDDKWPTPPHRTGGTLDTSTEIV